MAECEALLAQAWYLLAERTPLPVDCGACCGQACCAGDEEGMLLFPGERALLEPRGGFTFRETPGGTLALCDGHCDRSSRSLSCRIFPLFPYLDAQTGRVRAVYDPRAWRLCPLVRECRRVGLDRDFVRTVRTVGRLLTQDADCRRFLLEQAAEIDAVAPFLHLDAERPPIGRRSPRVRGNRNEKTERIG